MTLDCDLPLTEARRLFANASSEATAADLLDAAVAYWRSDLSDDLALAKDLRLVLSWLER